LLFLGLFSLWLKMVVGFANTMACAKQFKVHKNNSTFVFKERRAQSRLLVVEAILRSFISSLVVLAEIVLSRTLTVIHLPAICENL